MRSILKFLVSAVVFLGAGFLILCFTMKDNTSELGQAVNKINILVREEPRYVKIDNSNAKDEAGFGNYEYNLTSYDQNGNAHPIKFTGMGKLKQGHYLEITAKGTYVETYKETFKDKMPQVVADKIN
ncbi:YxeA family protein [Companilactobacillus sp. HBUAS56257]|jgi:uncharacterized protein (TIGR01655 family)|uniref:YxeA family protein n=1 Tax=Companilactobacillus sp. HBUAS56257 TaxID=3109360 RepID=UPI002FF304F8